MSELMLLSDLEKPVSEERLSKKRLITTKPPLQPTTVFLISFHFLCVLSPPIFYPTASSHFLPLSFYTKHHHHKEGLLGAESIPQVSNSHIPIPANSPGISTMDTNKAPPAKTPKTTFLTLPREIRQSILLQSLDTAAPGDQNVEMRRWRATLENIDVRLAEDMEYVVRIWNKSFGEEFYKDLAMWKRSCSEVSRCKHGYARRCPYGCVRRCEHGHIVSDD